MNAILKISLVISQDLEAVRAARTFLNSAPVIGKIKKDFPEFGKFSVEVSENLSPAEVVIAIMSGDKISYDDKLNLLDVSDFLKSDPVAGFLKKRLSKSETGGDPSSIKFSVIIK